MKKLIIVAVSCFVFFSNTEFLSVYASQTQTVTLTPSADATIEEGTSDNTGGSSALICSTTDGYFSFFMKFDLNAIPSGTSILNATLTLSQTAASGESVTISLYKVTSGWNESSVSGSSIPPYDSGVTYGTVVADSTSGVKSVSQDLKDLVQDWLGNSASNNGLYFKAPKGSDYMHEFGSKESVSKPQLSITYAVSDSSAPTISSISVSKIESSNVTISWKTNELSSGFVDYGTDATYGSVAGSGDFKDAHSVTLPDLEPDTAYHFRIRAMDEDGNEAKSNDQTFKTQADGVEEEEPEVEEETGIFPPKNVQAVSLKKDGSDYVHITWEHGQDDRSGYKIYRSIDDALNYKLLAQVGSDETIYDDEDVEAGKTYFYVVRTVQGDEESKNSDEEVVTIFTNSIQRTLNNFSFWKGLIIINVVVFPVFGLLYLRYRKLKTQNIKAKRKK